MPGMVPGAGDTSSARACPHGAAVLIGEMGSHMINTWVKDMVSLVPRKGRYMKGTSEEEGDRVLQVGPVFLIK